MTIMVQMPSVTQTQMLMFLCYQVNQIQMIITILHNVTVSTTLITLTITRKIPRDITAICSRTCD